MVIFFMVNPATTNITFWLYRWWYCQAVMQAGFKFIVTFTHCSLLVAYCILLIANYCPGKQAALVIIVVSLPCTTYLCGAFIVLCTLPSYYILPQAQDCDLCALCYYCRQMVSCIVFPMLKFLPHFSLKNLSEQRDEIAP